MSALAQAISAALIHFIWQGAAIAGAASALPATASGVASGRSTAA